jgi:hypothetical protein
LPLIKKENKQSISSLCGRKINNLRFSFKNNRKINKQSTVTVRHKEIRCRNRSGGLGLVLEGTDQVGLIFWKKMNKVKSDRIIYILFFLIWNLFRLNYMSRIGSILFIFFKIISTKIRIRTNQINFSKSDCIMPSLKNIN